MSVPPSHALVALSFEGAFVWKLPIDCTGPITEGIEVLLTQRGLKPFMRAGPADGFPVSEINDMRATAEGVQSGPGTGVSDFETPEASQVDLFRQSQHEAYDAFDTAFPTGRSNLRPRP